MTTFEHLPRSGELLEEQRLEGAMFWDDPAGIGPNLRTLSGYDHLKKLREAMKSLKFKENVFRMY
jgi:hypothetical protein